MIALGFAAVLWVVVHVGIAGTRVRDAVVGRLGGVAFQAVFSVASVVSITALVAAYNTAPVAPLWYAPGWVRWLLLLLMLPAFVLFVASVSGRNPTAVGGGAIGGEVLGIQRVTRHPMLWSFALWAVVHVIGNGDVASTLFFGAFLVTALVGMPSIDAKLARRDPIGWGRLAAGTSILPFGAIAAGRQRLVPAEIGWVPPAVGTAVWLLLFGLHRWLFGVSPLGA